MNLGQFYREIDLETAKHGALMKNIPGATRRAIRFLEQNYSFEYMRQVVALTLTSREFAFPPTRYKKLEAIRRWYEGDDAVRRYAAVPEVSPNDFCHLETDAHPNGYYKAAGKLYFDGYQTTAPVTTLELFCVVYTDFDCLSETSDHPLITSFESVLTPRVMMELGPTAREPDWITDYGALWQQNQQAMVQAQDDYDFSGPPERWVMGAGT